MGLLTEEPELDPEDGRVQLSGVERDEEPILFWFLGESGWMCLWFDVVAMTRGYKKSQELADDAGSSTTIITSLSSLHKLGRHWLIIAWRYWVRLGTRLQGTE